MTKKSTTSEQDLAKLNAFSVSQKDGCCEAPGAASGTSQPNEKTQIKEKLPRLKLEELVAQVPKANVSDADVRPTNDKPPRQEKTRCKEKLPVLNIEDLAAQVTEENAHKEISTGPAVGNEIW